MATDPTISIVMPAYNEADVLEQSVTAVVEAMRERGEYFELLVVENGSTDGTRAIGERLSLEFEEVSLLALDTPDYGRALRAGLLGAKGDIVVNFDVDYYDVDFVDRAREMMDVPDGPVVVVGSKRGEGAKDTRPWSRRLVTYGFSTILKVAFGLHVSDTHGIKTIRREPLRPLAERCRFGTDLFDTELILRAERAGMLTAETPVVVTELRPSRSSILSRIPRSLIGLARLRVALWRER